MDYLFSLNNAKMIPFDKYEKDFSFNVNGKRYRTSRIIADLLSPTIRNYHFQDPTINEFYVNTTNNDAEENSKESQEEDYFNEFLNLYKFEQNHIEETQRKRFVQYFLQLGNVEESLNLQLKLFEELEPDNVIDKIKEIIGIIQNNRPKFSKKTTNYIGFKLNESVDKIISYAASHFSEIPKEQIKNINEEILEEIISNESLKIESEEEFLAFIIEKYEKDRKFCKLFEYVEFQNVEEKMIERFISAFNIDDLSLGTWKKICKRLVPIKNSENTNERYAPACIDKPFNKGQEFKGIMHFLTEETKGNIHDNGTIEITSNSIYGNSISGHPKNLVEYQNSDCYNSSNKENSTVTFDFKNRAIQLTSYSIKTYNNNQNTGHLKNWSVEVSENGNEWIEIDRHSDDQTLNHPNAVATFDTNPSKAFYRFIRIRQTGPNWRNDYDTLFCLLEFYGKIKVKKITNSK